MIKILSEIDCVLSNFLFQNVQTSVGGGGVITKSERPNLLRPYQPEGAGLRVLFAMRLMPHQETALPGLIYMIVYFELWINALILDAYCFKVVVRVTPSRDTCA